MSPKNASIEDSPKKIGFPSPGEIFDPVARALEVIGDRWTLVLIRQLLGGPKGFQELRMRTGIAPRVLSSRLKQLTDDGFVESVGEGPRSLYGQRSPMTSSARATGSKISPGLGNPIFLGESSIDAFLGDTRILRNQYAIGYD